MQLPGTDRASVLVGTKTLLPVVTRHRQLTTVTSRLRRLRAEVTFRLEICSMTRMQPGKVEQRYLSWEIIHANFSSGHKDLLFPLTLAASAAEEQTC